MPNKIHATKTKLRKLAKTKRNLAYSEKSQIIAQGKLLEYILNKIPENSHVAGYCPIQTEISPLPILEQLEQSGYGLCLPIVVGKNKSLQFRSWKFNQKLIAGDYGVSIPVEGKWIVPIVIIVPLLAFDTMGYRLGYGGGYYDRTLEQLKKKIKIKAIGFAFSGQFFPKLPRDKFDYKLDTIVTDIGITEYR